MTSFHHSIGIHSAVPRLLGLRALVALPGLASCQDAERVVIEEASVTAGASPRPSLPRTITLTPNTEVGDRELVNPGIPFAPGELTDAALVRIVDIQNNEGYGSDAHNPELMMAIAAARHFETDPEWRRKLSLRADQLSRYLNPDCAAVSHTARAFNWQNRNPEFTWLLAQ